MKLSYIAFVWLPLFALAVDVENYEFNGIARQSLYACGYAMISIGTFCADLSDYQCYCTNDNAIMTVTGCLAATGRNTTDVYRFYSHYCRSEYNASLTVSDLVDAHSRYLVEAKNASDIEGFSKSTPVDVPLLITDASYIQLMNKAYKVFLGNLDIAFWSGVGGFGYWALMAVIAMVCNWGVVIFPRCRNVCNGTLSKWVRKYVTLAALGRKKRNVAQNGPFVFKCLVPTRAESLVIFGFFCYLAVVCAVEIYSISGDPMFANTENAISRYIADRTGIICTLITPLLLLFAGRNNVLHWITGWKFSTMLAFHRWIARMVVALAFVHSVGYTWIHVTGGYYIVDLRTLWMQWGVIGTATGGLLCFQGLLFFRRNAYEIFLVLHILLAGFFVVGTWFHVCNLGYAQIMYACFAVWGFDRFVRVVRLFWFGFPKATLTLLPDDTIKVEVPKPKSWPSIAGGHAWIHFLQPLTFWQNHPFTFIDSVEKENTIVFFCKAKTGITATLRKKLQKYPGRTTTVRVAVEGPYGETAPVSNHSTAVYVAGGSGIPGIYSEATNMAKKSQNSTRKTKLIWIVREAVSVFGFTNELNALKHLDIETTIFITRPGPECASDDDFTKPDLSSLENEKDDESARTLSPIEERYPHICFEYGRPDLKQLIVDETEEADKSVAFITCGHPILVDDLRYQVINHIDHTSKRLDFYEQLQVWA